MAQFNPILASKNIKQSFADYISTTFDMADRDYAKKLKDALSQENFIAKGPYLDVSGSYKTGKSLQQLMDEGIVSLLFAKLEPVAEKERELKLDRPLYLHQEQALLRANAGENIVVTTGTGSGKTECFLIPIINQLLREQEKGELDSAVRALIIYPMNALANDQIKRMRQLLKNYPQITFGLYNGNTEHTHQEALRTYRETNGKDSVPLENELIAREDMQRTPPHILITNYSMLEYMMLRPKDDAVISGAKLKFVVLDEAHIYRGTTGMETAMLMRRLRARLMAPDRVQYILTSATLGGEDANGDIIEFGRNLCGENLNFSADSIIRSQEDKPAMKEYLEFPVEIYAELADELKSAAKVFEQYGVQDYAPEGDDNGKIFEFLLHSRMYASFREIVKNIKTVSEIREKLNLTEDQMLSFVAVCTRAEQDGTSLMKARYHFFVRALEGAYITLSGKRELFLQRKERSSDNQCVFEIAICRDCGRIALVGKEENGYLRQVARKTDSEPNECEYYLLWGENEEGLTGEDDGEEDNEDTENDYVICPACGQLGDRHFGTDCNCDVAKKISIRKVNRTSNGKTAKCPACGATSFRAFYLGNDAATSVLGTELFEQLPDEVTDVEAAKEIQQREERASSIFKKKRAVSIPQKEKMRQFLCFSDSRSEAAYFSSYMETSYQEFLRRRGIMMVVQEMKRNQENSLDVSAFVGRLTTLFENEHTFEEWNPDRRDGKDDADSIRERCKSNAWVAVMNELFNARRSTSLVSLGVFKFECKLNDEAIVNDLSNALGISAENGKDLLDLLTLDGAYTGAIDAGNAYKFSDAEREYIFFSATPHKLVCRKDATNSSMTSITGWAGRKRENGNFYQNMRLERIANASGCTLEQADKILEDYWHDVFEPSGIEYALDICDFRIRLTSDPEVHVYRCKKCGRITAYNVKNRCAINRCNGTLIEVDPEQLVEENHYANLYRSTKMKPLQIKEHTAQLSRNRQTQYQQAFVEKKINALSCSTTFEMGVDVGGLETVYMRDVPPSPSNYVQRAGRAGRAAHTAAFVLTYAKLSSHDFTYYNAPERIISGSIQAPKFSVENEKVIYRHIFAIALSEFFAKNEDVYAGNDLSVLLNEGGYDRLKEFLQQPNERLNKLLRQSVPAYLHTRLGINDGSWIDRLVGTKGEQGKHGTLEESGVLEIAVQEYWEEVAKLTKEINACKKINDFGAADRLQRELKKLRGDDGKKSLIDFLARNNVLPKYGFPVDTVELQIGSRTDTKDSLRLSRDLQMAIAEYAPGAEIVADGKMYTSRYIRRMPGKNNSDGWEIGYYAKCPNCDEPNFTRDLSVRKKGKDCISCKQKIEGRRWNKTLEPRRGFISLPDGKSVPLKRPERDYKTDDYYVGDIQAEIFPKRLFDVNGMQVSLVSTANDTLAVVGTSPHRVCSVCGYASNAGSDIPKSHNTAGGYKCKNTEGTGSEYRLSHTFKTDVVKVSFYTPKAADCDTMLSVLYAVLEGISKELDIERTDIKGCLHQQKWEGSARLIYSLVLYDAVAGGAGHVRRIVTEDGNQFRKVLQSAHEIVAKCNCDPSCYQCIRNYYNQKIHDLLDRKKAADFLRDWLGEYTPVETTSQVEVQETDYASRDYGSWAEVCELYAPEIDGEEWDRSGISLECNLTPTVTADGQEIEALFVWQTQKVMIVEEWNNDIAELLNGYGWLVATTEIEVAELKQRLEEPMGNKD